MTETTCARCDTQGESQWRLRLEHESETTDEQSSYRLCRKCWTALNDRFGESTEGR